MTRTLTRAEIEASILEWHKLARECDWARDEEQAAEVREKRDELLEEWRSAHEA